MNHEINSKKMNAFFGDVYLVDVEVSFLQKINTIKDA